MGSYAKVNDGIVTKCIAAEEDFIATYDDGTPGEWIQTSYNTIGGVHYQSDGTPSEDQSKALRKNFAGIGFTYDADKDAFIPPKPHPSWTLNDTTCQWECSVDYPDDGEVYIWNEDDLSWDVVTETAEATE
jgi:hypothetical protein